MDSERFDRCVRRAALASSRRALVGLLGGALLAAAQPSRAALAIDRVPDCASKGCGDDGRGGTCGSCAVNERCTAQGTCVAIVTRGNHCKHKTKRHKKHGQRTVRACTADFATVCQLFYGTDAQTLANCAAAFASCCTIYRRCRNTPARQCLDETLLAFPRITPKGS